MTDKHVHEFRGGGASPRVCRCGVTGDQECPNGHPKVPENRTRRGDGTTRCRLCKSQQDKTYRDSLPPAEKSRRWADKAAKSKTWRLELRKKVFSHYGLTCVCCGESTLEFLALDHTNGGGGKHRVSVAKKAEDSGSTSMYKWLVDNGFPEGFQTLCHNCNFAKHFHRVCPHQGKR